MCKDIMTNWTLEWTEHVESAFNFYEDYHEDYKKGMQLVFCVC